MDQGQQRGRFPADHAYYIELRDRISNDFDGKGQSDRGNPTWQGGVSMIYTDEAHGYGNFGVDNPPAQTPVDSMPQPGNNSPNLNDAAFTLAEIFNGCTHIDNYGDPNGPAGRWKLPPHLKFTVTALSGLAPGAALPATPATASLLADVAPVCEVIPRIASRKIHAEGTAQPQTFDILLFPTGPSGVECRTGGGANADTHQVVFKFSAPVTFTGATATPESGKSGMVTTTSGSGTDEVIVNLGEVDNEQIILINLTGISGAGSAANITVPMGVLAGDSNADRRVNVVDTNQTKSNSGQLTGEKNFRTDGNLDGRINIGDTNFVKSHSGTALSDAPPEAR